MCMQLHIIFGGSNNLYIDKYFYIHTYIHTMCHTVDSDAHTRYSVIRICGKRFNRTSNNKLLNIVTYMWYEVHSHSIVHGVTDP